MVSRSDFLVKPGSRVRLADVDASFHTAHTTEEDAQKTIKENREHISELQKKLYGEKKHSLLIVLQGIDAAGKDGVCWHVMSSMDPQGTYVKGFKQPTAEELHHDFLWRIHRYTPALGEVAVFNRSHYEDVLVTRVHNLVPKKIWSKRYDMINNFEEMLSAQNTTILKFFLYISPDEQLRRFEKRLDDPARQWKISESDYKERALWNDYIAAYEDMLKKCSTSYAPWYVIPSNHKWFRNLALSHIIKKTLEKMHLKLPEPSVDLKQIRKAYHQAAQEKLK